MASLTAETSPYDVLTPDASGMTNDSTDNSDANVDPGVDDANVDETPAEGEGDAGDGADAADAEGNAAEGDDPDAKAAAEAAKAEDAQWKAKDDKNLPPALKELITNNPAVAKRLKEMYFTNKALQKLGTVAEVQKLKEAAEAFGGLDKMLEIKGQIDQMGGETGFQEAQQELGAWRDIDQQWVNGDSALVDHLATVNPGSFEKIAPAMFGKLGSTNPELYNHLASSIIYNTFANDGTITNILLMKQALAAGDTKLAATYFGKIEGRIGEIQGFASQAPKARAADPKANEYDQKIQGYEQKEAVRFQGDVQQRNNAWMEPKIKTETAAYLNGAEKTLKPETLYRIDKAVREEIWYKHLSTNDQFMKAKDKLFAQKDLAGAERLYKQYSDKLFPTVTRQILKEFGLNPGAKRAAGTPQGGGNGKPNGDASKAKPEQGFTMVDRLPKPEQVDNKATTFDMKLKDQYILKDGKKIQVRPLRKQ